MGGSGVGAAVDAFNLNASFFESAGIPVMGAIFNKLPLDGFYSLGSCKKQVSLYFDQYQPNKQAFGFVQQIPAPLDESKIDFFLRIFAESVDIDGILDATTSAKENGSMLVAPVSTVRPNKRRKANVASIPKRVRADIEQNAIDAGAAPSA